MLKQISVWWHNKTNSCYQKIMNNSQNQKLNLFLLSFFESSFFPIPPDVMIVPMVLAKPSDFLKIPFVATVGSVLGGCFAYFIGMFFLDAIGTPILRFYGYLNEFNSFASVFNEWGWWIVFGAGLTPFPYKVITIASGFMGLNLWVFVVSSFISRGLRFFAEALVLRIFGKKVQAFLEKNIGLLSFVFFILLLGSFLLAGCF